MHSLLAFAPTFYLVSAAEILVLDGLPLLCGFALTRRSDEPFRGLGLLAIVSVPVRILCSYIDGRLGPQNDWIFLTAFVELVCFTIAIVASLVLVYVSHRLWRAIGIATAIVLSLPAALLAVNLLMELLFLKR